MIQVAYKTPVILASMIVTMAIGCSRLPAADTDTVGIPQDTSTEMAAGSDSIAAKQQYRIDLLSPPVSIATLPDTLDVPYPLYPNGSRYRIGGENGLKVVLYETTDTFSAVEKFFNNQADKKGLSRQLVMSDYVRYSTAVTHDPWTNALPAIVIHEFVNPADATNYGAAPDARTNIIMSF